MFKFELGTNVHYLHESKVKQGTILSRALEERVPIPNEYEAKPTDVEGIMPCAETRIRYTTVDGTFDEIHLHETKADLISDLNEKKDRFKEMMLRPNKKIRMTVNFLQP